VAAKMNLVRKRQKHLATALVCTRTPSHLLIVESAASILVKKNRIARAAGLTRHLPTDVPYQ
jgi:hypothetical protein